MGFLADGKDLVDVRSGEDILKPCSGCSLALNHFTFTVSTMNLIP